jgi:hypothetical protein
LRPLDEFLGFYIFSYNPTYSVYRDRIANLFEHGASMLKQFVLGFLATILIAGWWLPMTIRSWVRFGGE